MSRSSPRQNLPRRPLRAGNDLPRRGFLALLASLFAGCSNAWIFTKSGKTTASSDEEVTGAQLIGDVAKIWGGDTQRVTSICLVTNLRGTGGEPAAGSDRRKMLIDIMKKNRVDDITGLLATKRVADAVVIGEIPAAAQKGDRFDVLVETPNGSETSSLRHGWLLSTDLKQAKSLGGRMVQGHTEAVAEGPIIVDSEFDSVRQQGDPTAQAKINPREVKGKIVGGGVVMKPRVFGLVILQKTTISQPVVIQNSINRRFNYMDRGAKGGVANAKDDDFIELKLDPQYRGNLYRYFRVILNVAVGESDEARAARLRKLRTMLLEPTSAMSAALQLEAIGPRGIETLLDGLESKDLQVRFLAAEALAYQDKHEAVPALRDAAETESAFRWHALAALSTITHVSALDALDALLHVASAETRYGAFRALKKRADKNPIFGAEKLGDNGQFVLHTVPSNAQPMIHYTRSREPEIVLFGNAIEMRIPDFMDGGKEIIVKASEDGEQIKICRYSPGKEDQKVQCAPRVRDFIHGLVEVGASYALIVQLLDQAKRDDLLAARLVADATPRPIRDYQAADGDTEDVAAPPPTSLMELPDLFQLRQSTRIRANSDEDEVEAEKDEGQPWYTKIGGWFGFEK
jgi:flagellar basal body P-ring protein FlgI